MIKETIIISRDELLVEFLLEKIKKGFDRTVSEKEFTTLILELLNNLNNSNWAGCIYKIENEDFATTCQKAIIKEKNGYYNSPITYENNQLVGNYFLKNNYDGRKYNHALNKFDIINFLEQYVEKIVNEKKDGISKFKIETTSKNIFEISKQISAYIVNDLMIRYVKENIKNNKWPSQCKDIDKYIFEKDLASTIDLEGTRAKFIELYNHSILSIAEMLSNDCNLQLSNNKSECLAYSNYYKIIKPFSFISNYVYNEYQLLNTKINIKIENEKINLLESTCVFSDPYDEWGDQYEEKNKVLSKDNTHYTKLEMLNNLQKKEKIFYH